MSTYYYRFQEYLQGIYFALIGLAILAGVLVVGWFVISAIYKKSPLRDLYQWIYLAGCAGVYLGMVAWFVR